MRIQNISIVGSGSFGTAMAKVVAPNVQSVTIIGRDLDVISSINSDHRNPRYLSEISLPENVKASTDFSSLENSQLIVFAIPTSATRDVAETIAKLNLSIDKIILSCAKGIEKSSGSRMSEVLHAVFPDNPFAVLSGPNHAEEMATGQATCAVIGADDHALACELQECFSRPFFRPYTSNDLAGIELGGAIKNVYAIAAGISHGLGLGDNAVAALVTRALAEMARLGTALGGQTETFAGLSGVGDLIVTCFSEHSRNHRVGLALGQGKTLEETTASLGMVAEGVPNTASIYEAARRSGVRTPIIDSVYSILYQDKPAAEAMTELLSRDTRTECD